MDVLVSDKKKSNVIVTREGRLTCAVSAHCIRPFGRILPSTRTFPVNTFSRAPEPGKQISRLLGLASLFLAGNHREISSMMQECEADDNVWGTAASGNRWQQVATGVKVATGSQELCTLAQLRFGVNFLHATGGLLDFPNRT